MDYYIEEDIDFVHMYMETIAMIESNINEIKYNRILNEVICLENHNYKGIVLLNEGTVNNIKNILIKLWNGIVKMWNTFVHKVEEMFKLEKKFLEDNKNTILKKKPVKAEISIYEYNHEAIAHVLINRYDNESILNFNKEAMLKALNITDTDKVSTAAKIYFRGESPKTKLSTELNFAEMYNYCYSFSKIKETIKNDLKSLEQTKNNVLVSANVAAKKIEENKPNPKSESTISFLLGKYITEADVKINTKVKTTAPVNNPVSKENKPDNAKNDGTIGANIKNIDEKEPDDATISNTVKTSNELGEDYTKLEDNIKLYYNIGGQILSAKLNVATEAFRDYMKILRWHVDNFTNKEKLDTDRKNPQTATDYTVANDTPDEETPL